LEEFYVDASSLPKYAILSHRWGEDEVSFEQLNKASAEKKEGFMKMRESARLAEQAGLSYIWNDTCCIDKSSSSELQEAINSMFLWVRILRITISLSTSNFIFDGGWKIPHQRTNL